MLNLCSDFDFRYRRRTNFFAHYVTSAATESQLWNSLWRSNRKKKEEKIDTIVLPINVHNMHWYLAIVRMGGNDVNLTTLNNIGMRNNLAEDKLLNTARRYHDKICAQTRMIRNGPVVDRNNSECTQVSQNREEHLHRTRQLKNTSHCLMPAFSKYDDVSSMEDMEEDVIYSEGEAFGGYHK